MTARSKHSSASEKTTEVNVVVLPVQREVSPVRSVSLRSRTRPDQRKSSGKSAELLSIRQHLAYKASLCIDDLPFIEQTYSSHVANRLLAGVRQLLDQEFGHLRVHRSHELFVVNHHCKDALVGGLLRVQFHSREIPLPATRDGDGLSEMCGIPLSWGVGQTLSEAETERLEK